MDRSRVRTQVHPLPLFYRRGTAAGPHSTGRGAPQATQGQGTAAAEKWTAAEVWAGIVKLLQDVLGFLLLCLSSLWEGCSWLCKGCWKKASVWWAWLMRKKEELDRWNPDPDHPLVKCIAESKIAGLKETVKKDRPILNRRDAFHLIIIVLSQILHYSDFITSVGTGL
jgi:hypothetical protein